MVRVEQSIAAPLEHLEFVVQPFNKDAIVPVDEIIEDFLPPAPQGVDELIEAVQIPSRDPFGPGSDFGFGDGWGDVLVKNRGQVLLQVVGLLQIGRVAEEQSQGTLFFGFQINRLRAQDPHAALQLLVFCGGEFFFNLSSSCLRKSSRPSR